MKIKPQKNPKLIRVIKVFLLYFINFSTIKAQKCVVYDLNLNKIAYNENNFNSVDSICSDANKNENSYCESTLSSCFCKKNYYGDNCEKKIAELNVVSIGITSGEFTLFILLLVIIFPLILIFGLFIILFVCRNNPNNISEKKFNNSYSKRKKLSNFNLNNINNNNDQKVIITNDIEKKINTGNVLDKNNIDFTQLKTDNTNLMLKRDFNAVNNITENNITNNDEKFKYSEIPLSTERKDDNMLITIRNNTELDNDTSAYKRPGIQNLNRTISADYDKKFDEIEEFTSEFKSSLQENFSENENFMNLIEDIFFNTENILNQREFGAKNRLLIKEIKTNMQTVFNKLTDSVPYGKNYLKANNFYPRYQQIFNLDDDTDIIEEDNFKNENSDLRNNIKRSNYDISFNNEKSGVYNREELFNPNKINLEIPESSRNIVHTETSYLGADTSNNEILENKVKPPAKKVFAIKSVLISKSPKATKKDEEKNVELSSSAKNQHQRNE